LLDGFTVVFESLEPEDEDGEEVEMAGYEFPVD